MAGVRMRRITCIPLFVYGLEECLPDLPAAALLPEPVKELGNLFIDDHLQFPRQIAGVEQQLINSR